MSTMTAIGQVAFSKKIGSYTTAIQCSEGDLTQLYTGDQSSYSCIPDFEAAGYDSPLLSFVVISSRVAEGVAQMKNVKWFFNETEITFGSNGLSTGTFAGCFEQVTPSASNGYLYPGIKVKKNLVGVANFAPIAIRAQGQITVGNDSDTVQASCTIGIQQNTGGMKNLVKISAVSALAGFTITQKGGSVQIKAVCYRGGTTLMSATALTYWWYRMSAGQWVEITSSGPETIGGSGNSMLTIHEADILVTGMYKCEAYENGVLFGQDTEKVVDASDCYLVNFHYTPAHATISDDPSGCHSVNVKVEVISRKTQQVIVDKDSTQALFTVLDPAGNLMNAGQNTTKKNSQDVTLTMVQQSETGVQVVVEVDVPY